MELRRQNLFWVKNVIVAKPLQNFLGFTTCSVHQRVEECEVSRTPGFDKVVDIDCECFVNFDSSRSGFRTCDSFAPVVLVNVEGFAGHVAVARLAQRWNIFQLVCH
jgi:hypothetical protein